jgi:hypothetical protein
MKPSAIASAASALDNELPAIQPAPEISFNPAAI